MTDPKPKRDRVDEASDESFPASDPPAHGSPREAEQQAERDKPAPAADHPAKR